MCQIRAIWSLLLRWYNEPHSTSTSAAPYEANKDDETWLAGFFGEGMDDEWMWNLEMSIFGAESEHSRETDSAKPNFATHSLKVIDKRRQSQNLLIKSGDGSAKRTCLSSDGRVRVVCRCRKANPSSAVAAPSNDVLVRAFHQVFAVVMDRTGASSLHQNEKFKERDSKDGAVTESVPSKLECDCGCKEESCCHDDTIPA